MDPRLRGDDNKYEISTFYDFINSDSDCEANVSFTCRAGKLKKPFCCLLD
jgi:hypothetical protein